MSKEKENKTVGKRKTCLACGRPLTGRQKKWCSNDDCEGYYALHPEKNPEYMKLKLTQEHLDELRATAKEEPGNEDYDRLILDAETDLEILKGTREPYRVTCSSCGEFLMTNFDPDLEPVVYNTDSGKLEPQKHYENQLLCFLWTM